MASYRIAVRYARSLFELSIDQHKVEEVKKDVDLFLNLCQNTRPLTLFLRNPVIPNYRKGVILKKIFESKVSKLTMSFIEIVTRKNREDLLVEIANIFIEKYREYKGILVASLESPVHLTQAEKNQIIKIIKEKEGKDKHIEFTERINKDMIGGYILTIGDRQINDSVAKKLSDLRQKLIV
ncbi:MAG TPA: ATP synthase F1 subunit delta [Cyclobacteriaceae bacterium]|nr:ATP synthase F1 subunit delta [Cyclobacteriaceae bacterium]